MLRIFFLVFIFSVNAFSAVCEWTSSPTVLEESPSHLLQYWDLENRSLIDMSTLSSSVGVPYRKQVLEKIKADPLTLLKKYSSRNSNANDLYNLDQVIKNFKRYVRPVQCLEALLLQVQINRNTNMLTEPTEFFALYLQKPDGQVRVYFLTDDMNGVRHMDSLFEAITPDIAQGWRLIGNLHNHSFFLTQPSLPQGVLAPSASDMRVFQNMKNEFQLQSASITNGFDTIFIPAEKFKDFRSAPEAHSVKN